MTSQLFGCKSTIYQPFNARACRNDPIWLGSECWWSRNAAPDTESLLHISLRVRLIINSCRYSRNLLNQWCRQRSGWGDGSPAQIAENYVSALCSSWAWCSGVVINITTVLFKENAITILRCKQWRTSGAEEDMVWYRIRYLCIYVHITGEHW